MGVGEGVGISGVVVVVVPLPAQGHLNQLLHLARLISSRGIPVHYAGSGKHNRQARERVQGWDPSAALNICFHDLPLPPFANPPPDPRATLKFPAHLQPLFEATLALRPHLASLLRSLAATSRRVIAVHDSSISFVAPVAASLPNVEACSFHSVSVLASLVYLLESRGKPPETKITGVDLPAISIDSCFTGEFLDFLRRQRPMREAVTWRLLNTNRAIEGQFIDLLAREPGWRAETTFAIGPLNPVLLEESGCSRPRHDCLKWLDRQPPASVVYVSFGTMSSLSDKEIREMAAGLEESRQRFIWVVRDADRGDIYAADEVARDKIRSLELPLGFERRVIGTGMVVRDWAPQLEILAHPSTGGFLSHCGWNSCMESMSMGVPIMAWPMHSDQPRNTSLVTEVLRVGITVRDWSRRDEVLPSSAIRDSIVRLMVHEDGREIRRRARDLGDAVRRGWSEGGTSKSEFDSFITHITS